LKQFDASVEAGTLYGLGDGFQARFRLAFLGKLIEINGPSIGQSMLSRA
jgi:hypothetical protein